MSDQRDLGFGDASPDSTHHFSWSFGSVPLGRHSNDVSYRVDIGCHILSVRVSPMSSSETTDMTTHSSKQNGWEMVRIGYTSESNKKKNSHVRAEHCFIFMLF